MHARLARNRDVSRRRGAVVIWLLVAMPVLLTMFFAVTTIGSLWLARTELTTLADAAALAGAKTWGDASNSAATRTAAHLAAEAVAETNTVLGTVLDVDANDDPVAVNNNAACPGTITLGRRNGTVFEAGSVPPAANERACRVQLTTTVSAPWFGGFGVIGPYTIQASSVAVYSSAIEGAGTPVLINISSATCP